eukprot:1389806-Rhodomonas_salina.2
MAEGALSAYASGDSGIEGYWVLIEHIVFASGASDASTLFVGLDVPPGLLAGICNRFVLEVLSKRGVLYLQGLSFMDQHLDGLLRYRGDMMQMQVRNPGVMRPAMLDLDYGSFVARHGGRKESVQPAQSALLAVLEGVGASVWDAVQQGLHGKLLAGFPVVFSQSFEVEPDLNGIGSRGFRGLMEVDQLRDVGKFFKCILLPLVIREKLESNGVAYTTRAIRPYAIDAVRGGDDGVAEREFDVEIAIPGYGVCIKVVGALFGVGDISSQVMIAGRLCTRCKVAQSGQRYGESEDSVLELLQGLLSDLQMYKQDLAVEEDGLRRGELAVHIGELKERILMTVQELNAGFCGQFCLANKAEDCCYGVCWWVGCVLDVCGVSVELQDGCSFIEGVLFCGARVADSADLGVKQLRHSLTIAVFIRVLLWAVSS